MSTSGGTKRGHSSSGDTEYPSVKEIKMATNSEEDKLDRILRSMDDLKKGQEAIRKTFDSKLEKLRHELVSSVDEKIKAVKTDIDLEMGKMSKRFDELARDLKQVKVEQANVDRKLESLELSQDQTNAAVQSTSNSPANLNPLSNTEQCIIIHNLEDNRDSVLEEQLESLFNALGTDSNGCPVADQIRVIKTQRLKSRDPHKPGLVKVALRNVEERKTVLSAKKGLKDNPRFKNLFIRGSQSHAERIAQMNTRTLLKEFGCEKDYRITSHGKLQKKNPQQPRENPPSTFNMEDASVFSS